MYDLSICLPAIRTTLWPQFYETLCQSCKRYSFEVVFVTPFDPPKELADKPNLKFIHSYCRPSTGCQWAVAECSGKLWFNGADDAIFVPDAIDLAMDQWHALNDRKAIINMRYTEWENYEQRTYHDGWWYAHFHPPLQKPSIPGHYRMLLNPLMSVEYFKYLGGFDCSYEYQNFNIHDFAFRAQYDGASIHLSPLDVMRCLHYGDGTPMGTADHWPITNSYPMDKGRFDSKYNNPAALQPDNICIDFDNWKQYTEPWRMRFGEKMYTSYEEMLYDRGIR